MGGMEEQVEKLPDALPRKRNPGWFQPGDRRINREGRPRGSKVGPEQRSVAAVRAPRADRLRLLVLPGCDLAWRLTNQNAPWIVNLPVDFEVVGCVQAATPDVFALVIRSETFPRIARGAPIPEFKPTFNGLRWRRS